MIFRPGVWRLRVANRSMTEALASRCLFHSPTPENTSNTSQPFAMSPNHCARHPYGQELWVGSSGLQPEDPLFSLIPHSLWPLHHHYDEQG